MHTMKNTKIRLKDESAKYALLEHLKTENGPFTSYAEIEQYLDSDLPDNTKILIKNKRLYNEVQYARYASTSLRTTAAVFRLKDLYLSNL